MNFIKRCWAEVSLDNLTANLLQIKKIADTEIICVVKANAYGHGDIEIVKALENEGVNYFAVATVREGMHLREHGCRSEIILLSGCLDDAYEAAADNHITLSACSFEQAKAMSDFCVLTGKKLNIHLKLNTGMTRVGLDCYDESTIEQCKDQILNILSLDGICVKGVFTHFSVSDEQDGVEYSALQFDCFMRLKDAVINAGGNISMWHCSNSGAIVNYKDFHLDAVRAGILLYGFYNGFGADSNSFKPILSLKTVVTQIRDVQEGAAVSYGRTFVTKKAMKLATIAIGYADGYPRSLSNCGRVIINGKYASIVGRVCMDQTVVDVTDIDCAVGDTVTVIGSDCDAFVSVDEIAEIDNTVNYEILCALAPRLPRIYLKNGERVSITEYI